MICRDVDEWQDKHIKSWLRNSYNCMNDKQTRIIANLIKTHYTKVIDSMICCIVSLPFVDNII